MRRETWEEERERLISYLKDRPKESDEALDYALDVLDGKKMPPSSSRSSHIQRATQC